MSERPGEVPFRAHVELLHSFLAHRERIIGAIEGVLNAQRKPVPYLQDRSLLSRHFEDCFFGLAAITPEQALLRGRLRAAHLASGFRPREVPEFHNDLVDPAEMMRRGFHFWQQTRWPGRNGRVRYAQALFNLYVLRCLEILSIHLWDAGSGAGERLAQLQGVLDELWATTPADQPVLVRDARWLIPLAQSPTADDLGAYFQAAEQLDALLPAADRIEVHKAGVQLAGGHLRSQLRHYLMTQGVALAEPGLVLSTRRSNALDFALTVQSLVPLLEAYGRALQCADRHGRLELASAICQGVSPDPELFVNRLDLLNAYTMIEYLFISDRDGQAVLTPMGRRHVRLLQEYAALIGRLSAPLYEDCPHFRPVEGSCSPYGVIYGYSSNITEHMALKTLQPDPATRFSLEDVFAGEDGADKLAWVSGWRRLPHIKPEVQKLYDYPQEFAQQIFGRIEQALGRGASDSQRGAAAGGGTGAAFKTGRLFIFAGHDARSGSDTASIPELPIDYIVSSDMQLVAANRARAREQGSLLHDRQEGMFLVSYETAGGWTAISKDILTDVLGAGRDAKVAGLPGAAIGVLRFMSPDLVVLPENDASVRQL
ncbi:MAG TPA: hypothetical protein VMB48_04540 [Steroidobacteraceae bacterium]|nr:hypothetical protein [Steroidobacteraceae bacterium]